MDTVYILVIVVLAVVAGLLAWKLSIASSAPQVAGGGHSALPKDTNNKGSDNKLDALKAELATAKEELHRKSKQLEEAREEAKKKLRREGKKNEKEDEKAAGPDARDVEIAGLKKGMAALESQLNAAKRDLERTTGEAERVRGDARNETEGAQKARDDERNRARSVAEENAMLKRTLDELRSAKKKESERPDVPGTGLDLKSLPTEAVQELARYFRKGEEFERLYHVSSGQMQLEKDRYQELQRRYFAVCRELALVAGQKPSSDRDAKAAAEGLVAGSDQAARTGGGQAGGASAAPGTDGTAAAAGEPGKKRRRRRRRGKKPGAQGELPGVAADGAEGADGAADEEGEDFEGDEGDDGPEGDEAPAAAAPESGPTPAPAA